MNEEYRNYKIAARRISKEWEGETFIILEDYLFNAFAQTVASEGFTVAIDERVNVSIVGGEPGLCEVEVIYAGEESNLYIVAESYFNDHAELLYGLESEDD